VNSPELLPEDQNPPEAGEMEPGVVAGTGTDELEKLVGQRDEELARANTHLTELEQAIATKDSEVEGLNQAKAEMEERLSTLDNSLAEAVASYKAALIQANPEILEELISGDTIQAVNDSLSQAEALVSRVRQGLEVEISSARIPAGAPERTSPDLSALSPREKIQQAIGGFSS